MADVKTYPEHVQKISHIHGFVHDNQRAVINRLSRAIGHLEKGKLNCNSCFLKNTPSKSSQKKRKESVIITITDSFLANDCNWDTKLE